MYLSIIVLVKLTLVKFYSNCSVTTLIGLGTQDVKAIMYKIQFNKTEYNFKDIN